MRKIFALVVTINLMACFSKKSEEAIELYNDHYQLKITTLIPSQWVNYNDVEAFIDDELIFQLVKGTKDTTSWIVLRIYKLKDPYFRPFNIDSLLNWQQKIAMERDTTVVLCSRQLATTSLGGKIGFFDYSFNGQRNVSHCRNIVFYRGEKVGVLEAYSDKDGFTKLVDDVVKNLNY